MAGFDLSRTSSQGDVTGKQFTYDVPATDSNRMAPGDVVVVIGTASADGTPQVSNSGALTELTGILMSVDPEFSGEALSNTGRTPSVLTKVKVNVDPNALYEADVTGTVLSVSSVNANIGLDTSVATLSGGLTISNMAVDGDAVAATATHPFRIVAILPSTTDGTIDGTRALVRVNNSSLKEGTDGIAV